MKVQVKKSHYNFEKYVDEHRWDSYYWQIVEALKAEGDNILVIGVGDGIVIDILKKYGRNVTTLDFDSKLKPDVTGSVTEIDKLVDGKYDAILCCQVLEHIPFGEFEGIIRMIKDKLNKSGIFILSLPNCSIQWKINLKVPKMPVLDKRILTKKPFQKDWDIEKDGFGEHYWEINAKGTEEKVVKKLLRKYYTIEKRFIPSNNLYHIFYVLK